MAIVMSLRTENLIEIGFATNYIPFLKLFSATIFLQISPRSPINLGGRGALWQTFGSASERTVNFATDRINESWGRPMIATTAPRELRNPIGVGKTEPNPKATEAPAKEKPPKYGTR